MAHKGCINTSSYYVKKDPYLSSDLRIVYVKVSINEVDLLSVRLLSAPKAPEAMRLFPSRMLTTLIPHSPTSPLSRVAFLMSTAFALRSAQFWKVKFYVYSHKGISI